MLAACQANTPTYRTVTQSSLGEFLNEEIQKF